MLMASILSFLCRNLTKATKHGFLTLHYIINFRKYERTSSSNTPYRKLVKWVSFEWRKYIKNYMQKFSAWQKRLRLHLRKHSLYCWGRGLYSVLGILGTGRDIYSYHTSDSFGSSSVSSSGSGSGSSFGSSTVFQQQKMCTKSCLFNYAWISIVSLKVGLKF